MWDIDQTLCTTWPVGSQSTRAALHAITGRAFETTLDLAGRTDRYTCARALEAAGIADPEPYFERFFTLLETEFVARRHLLSGTGGALPGARQLLAALADRPHITQTVVTGNIPAVAREKTAAFDLARYLDFEIGGYGCDDQVRSTLVRLCRERSEAKHGQAFTEVLVIGDTPHDIEGALVNGVTAIGVATGRTSAADLRAAGAHAVLNSLADVDAALTVLG
jgi:phosphoglycolate phosphatase-like HAD superfamily hydrolase